MLSQRTQKRLMDQKEQIISIISQEKTRVAKEILLTGLIESATNEADFESSVNLLDYATRSKSESKLTQ